MEDPLKSLKVPAPMAERFKEAAALVNNCCGAVRIHSHYDGDGICSAGIVAKAVHRAGKRFHVSMSDVMKKEDVQAIKGDFELLIITDMGSTYASDISDKVRELGVRGIVLDHHRPEKRDEPFSSPDGTSLLEINPRFHGIDGTNGGSGSTLSFLLAMALSPENADLSIYSLAGSIADRQHVPEFTGLNHGIKELAMEMGLVTGFKGMPLQGTNIEDALIRGNEPFIKGVSGDLSGARALLGKLRIDPEKKVDELDEDSVKVLNSFIYVHLLKNGVHPTTVAELFRENLFSHEWGSLSNLAYMIDSCGRSKQTPLGFEVVWGSKEAFQTAMRVRVDTRKRIQEHLLRTIKEGVHTMDSIQWLEVSEDSLAGTIAGIAHNFLFDHEKPMLALSTPENGGGKVKVSSRGSRRLCSKGLDLGAVMREASAMYGGEGGGHDVAAGGSFQEGNTEGFLSMCDMLVGKQLKGKGSTNAK